MKYFLGIVPPESVYNTIINIQNRFGDNRVEPHITLSPPVTPLNDVGWLQAAKAVTKEFAPFNVTLPATGFFGNRVLFITVESIEIFPFEKQLSKALMPFQPPSPQAHNKFHPHLTLGRLWCGFTKNDFAQMKQLADEFLQAGSVSFTVNKLRVYHKPLNNKRWQALEDFQLGE